MRRKRKNTSKKLNYEIVKTGDKSKATSYIISGSTKTWSNKLLKTLKKHYDNIKGGNDDLIIDVYYEKFINIKNMLNDKPKSFDIKFESKSKKIGITELKRIFKTI